MSTFRDWAELLRVSALFTVPGDVLAGAAAGGARPTARTVLAAGASLCLYEAGMALNDWADREEDSAERPHRPIPSGRIASAQALTAGVGLTAAGVGLAAAAGRPAALCASVIAGTVWAYDLRLKHTPAGPAAMAAARGLNLLLGTLATVGTGGAGQSPATAGGPVSVAGAVRHALLPAAVLGSHTYAVTTVSRAETRGGSPAGSFAALGATIALGALAAARQGGRPLALERWIGPPRPPRTPWTPWTPWTPRTPRESAQAALAGVYVATAARPFFHCALNPSPPLTQRAVGAGIRAMIPLQAALAARSGALVSAGLLTGLAPVARRVARAVSVT